MSMWQWLQQKLGGLELAGSMDSQKEGDKYSQGPETVAAWNVIGSMQEHMQGADDEHLLHPPLDQDWVLDAGTYEGTVISFIHSVTRCHSSLRSCQMLADVAMFWCSHYAEASLFAQMSLALQGSHKAAPQSGWRQGHQRKVPLECAGVYFIHLSACDWATGVCERRAGCSLRGAARQPTDAGSCQQASSK